MAAQKQRNVTISSVRFDGYKAFRSFSISLQRMNVLVGPNNSGKSTIIRAFRILEVALRQANAKKAEMIQINDQNYMGYRISDRNFPVSLENVHTDYEESDARINFRCNNGNSLALLFPSDGGCILVPNAQGKQCHTPGRFKNCFPISIQTVPELGPLEDEEFLLNEETIRRGLSTHRASRHFRNYWRLYPEGFDEFANMVSQTWPGMEIERPELPDIMYKRLTMFCREDRISREIYWSDFGFQIWCQILTHLSRGKNATVLVIDEPEVYLHPDVQRQLVGILRDIGPDIVIASHSTEIIGESDPYEILVVDKKKNSASRLKDINQIQTALDNIGSVHNVKLTHLARTGRLLYIEGSNDGKILRRFARKLGLVELASGNDITMIESEGFSSWKKIEASAWAFEKALQGQFRIGAVFDRDYFSNEEIEVVLQKLSIRFPAVYIHDRKVPAVYIHDRKEIENYMLVPGPLNRAIQKTIRERNRKMGIDNSGDFDVVQELISISDENKSDIMSQLIGKRSDFIRTTGKDTSTVTREVLDSVEDRWANLESRLALVPGKKVLRRLREKLKTHYSINLTDIRIIDEFRTDEIPADLVRLLRNLDTFRTN